MSFSMIRDPIYGPESLKIEAPFTKSEHQKAREKLLSIVTILKNEDFNTAIGKLYQSCIVKEALGLMD